MRKTLVLLSACALMLTLANPALAAPPANDQFADRETLVGASGAVAGTTIDATSEAGEPLHGQGSSMAGTTVWYRWTASAQGTLLLDFSGNDLDTYLAVYTGTAIDQLTLVKRESRTNPLRLFFRVTPGTEYSIAIDSTDGGLGPPSTGPFTLGWTLYEPPANDDLVDAQALVGASGTLTANNGGATGEAGEPNPWTAPGGASLWYAWTPPDSGRYRIDVTSPPAGGITFAPLVAVYTGADVTALTEIASTEQFFLHQKFEFDVEAGTEYLVVVDGMFEDIGDFELTWRPAGPPNDDLADMTVLEGPTHVETVDTTHAAKEIGEPDHAGNPGGASAWYQWDAPWTGTATFTAEADGFDPMLAVYRGWHLSAMDELVPHQSEVGTDGVASVTIPVGGELPGQFVIALDGADTGSGPGRGDITFTVDFEPNNDDLADAETIGCCGGGTWASTAGATAQSGEPGLAGAPAANSVWFRFTAELTGTIDFYTTGEFVPARIGVFAGSTIGGLVPIASDAPDDLGASRIRFHVDDGETFLIAIDSVDGLTGQVGLGYDMVVGSPTSSVPAPETIEDASVPLRISWNGPQGAEASFQVEQRVGSADWAAVTSTTTRSTTLDVTPGVVNRFRVRALVPLSVTPWTESDDIVVDVVDDTAGAVRYRGAWSVREVASASGGAFHRSVDRGASARLSETARGFALVAPKGPAYGKAQIFIDGVFVRTVNLYAPTSQPRRIVYRRMWASAGPHRIGVKVTRTRSAASAGFGVPIDAFVVID